MRREVAHTINDILETIERVQGKTAGETFISFDADWELQFIVQRGIEIISEASRRLASRGIGNVLRHECHTISNKVIWDVVQSELPRLKAAVEAISEGTKR
jgi:uncharacterized protein with HEPN domain